MAITFEITVDENGAVHGLRKVDAALIGMEKTAGKAAGGMESVSGSLGKLAVGAFAGFGVIAALRGIENGLRSVMAAGIDAERQNAKLEATWRATGRGAQVTTNAVREQALAFQKLTGIDDDVVIGAQAVLATYQNIATKTFPEVIARSADLAVLFGGDLTDATRQLAFALNDPAEGLTRLRRAGIQFSDAQEKQIKNFMEENRLAEAQAVVMASLKDRIGGVAEEMGETASGRIDRLKGAWSNLKEAIWDSVAANEAFLGTMKRITEGLERGVESAAEQKRMQAWMNRMGIKPDIPVAAGPTGVMVGQARYRPEDIARYEFIKRAEKAAEAIIAGNAGNIPTPTGKPGKTRDIFKDINPAHQALYRKFMEELFAREVFADMAAQQSEDRTAGAREIVKDMQKNEADRIKYITKINEDYYDTMQKFATERNQAMADDAQFSIEQQQGAWLNLGSTIETTMMHAMSTSGNVMQNIAAGFKAMLESMAAQYAAKAALFAVVSMINPEFASKNLGSFGKYVFGNLFESGGYTGSGARDELAGFVHRGEYVIPASAVSLYGKRYFDNLVGGRGDTYHNSTSTNLYLTAGGQTSRAGGNDREFVTQLRRVFRDNPGLLEKVAGRA